MKKILYIALIAFIFTGCGTKGKPKDLDEDDYKAAKQIIVIIDNYLDKRLTEREAYEQSERLSGNFSSNAPDESTESTLNHIAFKVKMTFFNGTYEALDTEKIKDYKEEIIDCIGE